MNARILRGVIMQRICSTNLLHSRLTYHPAYWLMRRRIAETREMICDELAAATGCGRAEYAASLLRLARAMATPAARTNQAIGVFDGNTLEERIMRLTMDMPKVSRTQKDCDDDSDCLRVAGRRG